MNEQIKKLSRISKKVDVSNFYVIYVYPYELRFQGPFNSRILSFLIKHGFEESIDGNGYIDLKRSNIVVTLT